MKSYPTNESIRTNIFELKRKTYVEILEPGEDKRIPSSKIACGEKPLVECEEAAKDAPKNDVGGDKANADTLVANSIHLAGRHHVGKNTLS